MTYLDGTVFDYLLPLIDGGLRLDSNTYAVFQTLPGSSVVAWAIVIGAGVSQALGKSAILFLNRVRPSHFVYALLAVSLSLATGLLVWLVSIWAVTRLVFGVELPFGTVARTLGFACLPLLFSFLAAMPYFGVTVFGILAFWCLLGVATGITALSGLTFAQALAAATLGWVAWQVLERTIGRPVVALGKRLEQRAAGVELTTDILGLGAMLEEEVDQLHEELVKEVLGDEAPAGAATGAPSQPGGATPKDDAHEAH